MNFFANLSRASSVEYAFRNIRGIKQRNITFSTSILVIFERKTALNHGHFVVLRLSRSNSGGWGLGMGKTVTSREEIVQKPAHAKETWNKSKKLLVRYNFQVLLVETILNPVILYISGDLSHRGEEDE